MKLLRYCAMIVMLTCMTTGVMGQSAPADRASGQEQNELKGIREALDRLVALHRADEQYREVDLVLKRIDLWVRRLAPLEQRLVSAEAQIRSDEENLQALERMHEQNQSMLDEEIREGTDTRRSGTRRMLEDIERSRIGVEESMRAARLRVQEHENELARGQKQIAILDESLLELLESDR